MKGLQIVQAERLELSHLSALDPKSSVSTNSTTPATFHNVWRVFLPPDNYRDIGTTTPASKSLIA